VKCPKCDYLGFETGDRCRNCGYDFSLLSVAQSEPADYEIHPAAVDDVPVHVIDEMEQPDPWMQNREDPLGGKYGPEPSSRDAVDDGVDDAVDEGLTISLDTSLLFRLDKNMAAQVYQSVGADYAEKIVEPTLRAAIRAATSAHTANALYTNARELVQSQIQEELTKQLAPRGVVVENVLLRDVQLPAMLKSSIEAKQQAEQDALRMSFILQKEKQEAERKRIEAQGIADFQKIVATGISPQLLEWKGIEATEKLAASSNAKVVIIGNSKNGLPLVLEPR